MSAPSVAERALPKNEKLRQNSGERFVEPVRGWAGRWTRASSFAEPYMERLPVAQGLTDPIVIWHGLVLFSNSQASRRSRRPQANDEQKDKGRHTDPGKPIASASVERFLGRDR